MILDIYLASTETDRDMQRDLLDRCEYVNIFIYNTFEYI